MDYIITKNENHFKNIGNYNYCSLDFFKNNLSDVIIYDSETKPIQGFHSDGALVPRFGEIFAIQIGTKKDRFLIDCTEQNYHPNEVFELIKGKTLLGQNLTFDLNFMYKYGFYPKNIHDTFLMSLILYNGKPYYEVQHDLAAIFKREAGIHINKDEQKNIHKNLLNTPSAINYCFEDVRSDFFKVARIMWNKLTENNMIEAYHTHRNWIKALAYMEYCGIGICEESLDVKIENDFKKLKESEQNLIDYIYDNLEKYRDNQQDLFSSNKKVHCLLSSTKQMLPVFKDLGIDVINSEGKESLKEDVINKSKHEFIDLWLNYKGNQKDVTTYGSSLKDMIHGGRVYSAYKPILDTARISNRTNKGRVLKLNAPTLVLPSNEKTRSIFKAKKGNKLIVCDYDGQENVVGADLHNCTTMISSIHNGDCLHCAFARLIFPELKDLSDDEIKNNHKDKRQFSKAPRFAFSYGGTAWTVSANVGCTMSEALRLESLYKKTLHPQIFEWGEKVLEKALKVGYIESVEGFRLHLNNFDTYQSVCDIVDNFTEYEWKMYSEGKKQRAKYVENIKLIEESEDFIEPYYPTDPVSYDFYMESKESVSKKARLRAEYLRLCLNNPVQTRSAFQTKRALTMIFNEIVKRNWIGKVLICVVPHDEIVVECPEELAPLVAAVVENSMKEAGDYYLSSGLVEMSCTADIEDDWYGAKKVN